MTKTILRVLLILLTGNMKLSSSLPTPHITDINLLESAMDIFH